jgi:hypothetical protein
MKDNDHCMLGLFSSWEIFASSISSISKIMIGSHL